MQTSFAALRNEKKRNKRPSPTPETDPMSIFHLDVSTVKRSDGRSASACAAYRSGQRLYDERVGKVFDYSRRKGVETTFLALPAASPDWSRNELWNRAEASETRKNSTVAREWMVALPAELDAAAREQLVRDLSAELVGRYGIGVDCAIHKPGDQGDDRNHHAHLLTTTRAIGADGFGAKTRVLDAAKTGGDEIKQMRAWWADACNAALERSGRTERIDPRAKAVQAMAARAFALEADQEAATLEVIGSSPTTLAGVVAGLKVAAGNPGALLVRKPLERAAQRRAEAAGHRDRAERMDLPPERHRGPKSTAIGRKLDAEDRRKSAETSARRAVERAREAERVAKAERDREAALRAEQDAMALRADREEESRDQERLEAEVERRANVKTFTAKVVERADSFPTALTEWRFPKFEALEPDSLQSGFRAKHGDRLTRGEITAVTRVALTRWISRIVEDLPALKPMHSIWVALTGGHIAAGQALKDALESHPDLAEPLRPTIEAHEQANRPKPSKSNPPAPGGPSM